MYLGVDGKVENAGFSGKPNAFETLWCRLQESNPRPSVYKTAALPTELNRRLLAPLRQVMPKVQPSVRASWSVSPAGAKASARAAWARIPAAVTKASVW